MYIGKLVCIVIVTIIVEILVLVGIYDLSRDDFHPGVDHTSLVL